MAGANGWRQAITGQDWARDMEKRVLHEERRPQIRTAADIMGPSLGPYAIRTDDWNSDEAAFNGILYTEPGALNSPDIAAYWMGTTMGTADGFGVQHLWEYRAASISDPIREFIRRFATPAGALRVYSSWDVP